MAVDISMLAPQGGMPQGQPQGTPQGAPQGQPAQGGQGPGAIEAFKAGVKALMNQGLSVEQIIEAMLAFIAQNPNMNIPEEQIRKLVEQTAAESGQAQMGQAGGQAGPPMGGQVPPMGGAV